MTRLGSLLVDSGVCNTNQIADAVRQQVVLGGRIGANLVELGIIDEATLARYLGKLHGTPALFGERLRPDANAMALLPRAAVDRLDIIPYRLRGGHLQVLCLDPRRLNALEEVTAQTGHKVDPVVVPELRFWKLLSEFYKIHRGSRGLTLDEPISTIMGEEPVAPPAAPAFGRDLMSEEAFDKIYQSDPNQDPRPAAPAVVSPSPVVPAFGEPGSAVADPFGEPVMPTPQVPDAFLTTRVHLDEAAEDDLPLLTGDDLEEIVVGELLPSEALPGYDVAADGPVTFKMASELLAKAADRDQVARTVLRFAHSLFRRAMLFTVHRTWVVGWDAVGEGIDRMDFRKLVIRLDEPSLFQTVVNNRAHYLGGLQKTPANIGFLKAMGKKVPLSSFALPVLVQGRVVNILYGDDGHKNHCASDIGELQILALKISQSYEALFQARWEEHKPT